MSLEDFEGLIFDSPLTQNIDTEEITELKIP